MVLAFTYNSATPLIISNNNDSTILESAPTFPLGGKVGNSQFGLSYLINAAVATVFLLLGLAYNQPIVVGIALL